MAKKTYFLIIIFILFSFFLVAFYHFSHTGKVIGEVNITIVTITSLNFTTNYVNFGPGSVFLNSSYAIIDTKGNVINGNWTSVNQGLIVENIGNTNLTVFLKSDNNARDFIGGTSPQYKYSISNSELNSCQDSKLIFDEWVSFNSSGYGDQICDNFGFSDLNDSMRIDLELTIPSDSLRGERSDIITVTGVAV
jgi:hypothetical protein